MTMEPTIPDDIRISQSSLTDEELAFIEGALLFLLSNTARLPGWTVTGTASICGAFKGAAAVRGIKNGMRVVAQTVDLRS